MKNLIYTTRLLLSLTTIFLISFDAHAQSPIPPAATLELIASGIQQQEGPVWVDSVGLLFSDIRGNKIYKWTADKGKEIFLSPSDSSNGLTLDLKGRLILTQMGKRRVSRQEADETITPIAVTYNGKKFNSPNDLVVKSDGSIFFTDPDFNIPTGQHSELGFRGIYRISPSGNIRLLDSAFDKPNGICFSPDEKKLYVNESPKGEIYVWDIINDSTISNKKLFNKVSPYADGMKVDPAGNLYCTGSGGVWIFSPEGKYLDKIVIQNQSPSNCAWGDSDRKTLYITSGSSVYRIRLAPTTGVDKRSGSSIPESIKLFQNYPNPFNPSTTISWQQRERNFVNLKVYDSLGCMVATLLNEYREAGIHNSGFNTDNYSLPSGIYYYRLTVGNFSQTRKMILLK